VSDERINAAVEASALIRQAQANGEHATLLRRGDSERGALLLVIRSRGQHVACLQRQLELSSGKYKWNPVGPKQSAGSAEIDEFLVTQARFDPDLWQIELDIAEPERFIAETSASG
jgi:hypothetical protein